GVVGSVRPISRLEFANDTLRFSLPPQWEAGNGDFQFVGVYAGDSLAGTLTTADGKQLSWGGHRAPSLARAAAPQWGGGAPVKLFNGMWKEGWEVCGGENEWKEINDVVSKNLRGGNLVTEQT